MTNWRDYIMPDKAVLLGKPTIKGTRLSVEFVLKLDAAGWTEQQILKNYPRLTKEALQAVFASTEFDWDALVDEVMKNRQQSNRQRLTRLTGILEN